MSNSTLWRDDLLYRLAATTNFEYPLMWSDERTTIGDYDGRNWTIEVFNIPSTRQRAFFGKLRRLCREIDKTLGRQITVILHTPQSTKKHYSHLFPQLHGAEIIGNLKVTLAAGGGGDTMEISGILRLPLELAA